MSQQVTPETFGAELAALQALLESAPIPEAQREATTVIRKGFGRNFAAAQSADGRTWPARRDPKAGGRSGWPGHPLLIDTGDMFLAATSGGGGHVTDLGLRHQSHGVDEASIPYAGAHNYGIGQEEREFLDVTSEFADQLEQIYGDALHAVLMP